MKNFSNFWVEVHAGYNWSLHDHQPKNHEKWKISDYFWVEVHAGDSWSLHDHQPKNHEKWKISNDFWVEEHAGYNWSLHDHQPENQKLKNFNSIFGLRYMTADPLHDHHPEDHEKIMIFGLRYTRGTTDPFTITSLKTMKNEKFQMIFGLRYTRGTADPFTITILKTMKNEKFQMIFGLRYTRGDSWSLHDHHPENNKRWKISVIFGLRYTRGTTDPFTITSLKTMRNEKFQMIFRVEVHAGDSWSLHDHQPKNHEKWKISNDFWVGTRGGQLIPSRSPSWKKKLKNFNMIFGLRKTENWWSVYSPVEVHAGDSWSLHDHHFENDENWKSSKWFLGWGTRGGQLIPSRSPS